jgi:hypothetical protein
MTSYLKQAGYIFDKNRGMPFCRSSFISNPMNAIIKILLRQLWNSPASKENKGGADTPKPAEQGGRQQQLHHPPARNHEDGNQACHEDPH